MSQLLGSGLVEGVIAKATILLLLATIVTLVLRRSSAAMRHWVWAVALAGLVALPILTILQRCLLELRRLNIAFARYWTEDAIIARCRGVWAGWQVFSPL